MRFPCFRYMARKCLCAVALGALYVSAWAQGDPDSLQAEADEAAFYRALSLSTLIDMPTSVASAKTERTSDAPGAVTVYDKNDFNLFNYYTIKELADITPGYSSRDEYSGGPVLETRGAVAPSNVKHLVLIDDIPVSYVRLNQPPIKFDLPLLFAQRVEFLRGPASALYGIGAFNGVINVVPQQLDKPGQQTQVVASAAVEAGTPKDAEDNSTELLFHRNQTGGIVYARTFMGSSVVRSEHHELQCSYSYHDRTASQEVGYIVNLRTGEYDTTSPSAPFMNNETAQFFRLQSRITSGALHGAGFGLIGFYNQNGFGTGWTRSPKILQKVANSNLTSALIPYLRYDRSFSRDMWLNVYAKGNLSRDQGAQMNTYGFFNFDAVANNLELKAKYGYDITDELGLVGGANFDMRGQDTAKSYSQAVNGEDGLGTLDYSRMYGKFAYTYSAFLQARGVAPLLNGLIVTAGVRSDNGNLQGETYHQFSPRVALVLKIIDYLNAKAMYATALKAPTTAEISVNKEKQFAIDQYNQLPQHAQVALRPLRPEVIHSFEGNLTFAMNTIYASGTYFFTMIDDPIGFGPWFRAINMDYYQNSANNTFSSGGEVEVRYAPFDFLRVWASSSYTKTWGRYRVGNFLSDQSVPLTRDTTVENVSQDIPSGKTYLGVNYRAPFGLSSFVVLKGIWAQVRAEDVRDGKGADFDPGYWLMDLSFQQPIGHYFTLEAGIANVLNTQYYFGTGNNHGEIPGANRTFSLGVKAEL